MSPDLIQLHGAETPERVKEIGELFARPTMKAIGVASRGDLAVAEAYDSAADALLIDAKPPKDAVLPGGNGRPFDWRLTQDFRAPLPWLLSGGLDPATVETAIALSGARGVDVSSGVESAPGVKDPARIRTFVAAARRAFARAPCGVSDMSKLEKPNSYRDGPNERGRFGIYGGRFVPETLMPLILSLEKAYEEAKADPAFKAELNHLLKHYVGRPSPLYFAERLTEHLGGAKIYFKREELNHTGAHKINNVIGQILLARRMGKKRIIAETGAGQHGVATATACARFGLECIVFMGAVDVERQKPNVFRMKMLGAEVRAVEQGAKTLKDAMNEALRDWVTNVHDTYYCIGTVAGPHPYPAMVRDFQCVIGEETRDADAGGRGPPARQPRRLHRRRLKRHRPLSSVPRRAADRDVRGRSGRAWARRSRWPRSFDQRRQARRSARQPHLSSANRRRSDPRRPFDLRRARLSGRRALSTPGSTTSAG